MNKNRKAFFGNSVLIFAPIYGEHSGGKGAEILSESKFPLEEIISKIEKLKISIIYLSEDPEKTWKRFVSYYTLSEAAGGLVKNHEDHFLFIFRSGKWDLPKGKAEYDELPETTAIREVEEECGIDQLSIEKKLLTTFHTFEEKGKKILKQTNWFLMSTTTEKKPSPQIEEHITEVVWMTKPEIESRVYLNTYASVIEVLDDYFIPNE